jgi:hypothetical protein
MIDDHKFTYLYVQGAKNFVKILKTPGAENNLRYPLNNTYVIIKK